MLKEFKDLIGHTIIKIDKEGTNERENEQLIFTLASGEQYKLHHSQDCCETVVIEDIIGDLDDLLHSPIFMAEEATSEEDPPETNIKWRDAESLWTFYKLATAKGYVTIRWFGTHNGYYSISVEWAKI